MQNHDDLFRVWRYGGERTLPACIRNLHTDLAPVVMVWVAIGYTTRTPLVRCAVPFLRSLKDTIFQQDNRLLRVVGLMSPPPPFITEVVGLFPWPARSPDLSPIENVWSWVAERLGRHSSY